MKKRVTILLDEETYNKLKEKCKSRDRGISYIIRSILQQVLD